MKYHDLVIDKTGIKSGWLQAGNHNVRISGGCGDIYRTPFYGYRSSYGPIINGSQSVGDIIKNILTNGGKGGMTNRFEQDTYDRVYALLTDVVTNIPRLSFKVCK